MKNKDTWLGMRIDSETKETLRWLAERDGVTMSEKVCTLVRRSAERIKDKGRQ